MLAHTLRSLPSEDAVREYLEDYNARARRENSAAVRDASLRPAPSEKPPLLVPLVDVEGWVSRWHRFRQQ